MKINLKQLAKIEKTYIENGISLEVLKLMLSNVLNFGETSFSHAPNNIKTAVNTLKELKILVMDEVSASEIQQLNS